MSLCLGEAFCIGKGDLELGPLRCILLQYRLMPGMDSAHLALCSATGAHRISTSELTPSTTAVFS